MFLTVHATTAVAISQQIENPIVGFFVGLISHYALDAIPHGDEAFFNRFVGDKKLKAMKVALFIDLLILTPLLWFLYSKGVILNPAVTSATVFGSMLPDFLSGFYLITKQKFFKKILKWNWDLTLWSHHWIFKKTDPEWAGFSIQIIFLSTVLFYLL